MEETENCLETSSVLYIATFLAQMTLGISIFTTPIYAYRLGASPFLIGLIGASAGLTYTVTTVLFGMVSDRFERKRLTSMAMVICAFAYVLYIFPKDPNWLIFIRLIEWTASGLFWPSMEALISDSAEPSSLDRALTRYNVAWGSAMVISPFIAGFLITGFSVKTPFYLSLTVSLFTSVWIILFVGKTQVQGGRKTLTESLGTPRRQNSVFSALTSTFLFSFNTGAVMSLFPAYATGLDIPAYEIGLIILMYGLAETLAFSQARRIENVFTKGGMLILSPMVFTLSTLMIAVSSTPLLFTLSFAAFGLAAGIAYSASLSLMLRGRISKRGLAAGMFESTIGLGYLLGPLIGGILSEIDLRAPYILTALMGVATGIIQIMLRKSTQV